MLFDKQTVDGLPSEWRWKSVGYCFQAALDVLIRCLLALYVQNEQRAQTHAAQSDGQWCLSMHKVRDQAGHNNFKHRKSQYPSLFAMNSGAENVVLYIGPGSHKFLFYMNAVKSLLANKWFWSGSWFLQILYPSPVDNYSIQVLYNLTKTACPMTSTWYLRMLRFWMPRPLHIKPAYPLLFSVWNGML